MKRLTSVLVTLLLAAVGSQAVVIDPFSVGLLNTGVDANTGNVRPGGWTDNNYKIVDAPPLSGAVGGTIVVVDNQFPIPPWTANDLSSKWISVSYNGGANPAADGGKYTYQLSFTPTGYQGQTVNIQGNWSTDNAGIDIKLNLVSSIPNNTIGYGSSSNPGDPNAYSFLNLHPFSITGVLNSSGDNLLDFVVQNGNGGSDTFGPTGLRVQFSSFSVVPEYPTFAVGAGALLLLLGCGWKVHSHGTGVIRIDHSGVSDL